MRILYSTCCIAFYNCSAYNLGWIPVSVYDKSWLVHPFDPRVPGVASHGLTRSSCVVIFFEPECSSKILFRMRSCPPHFSCPPPAPRLRASVKIFQICHDLSLVAIFWFAINAVMHALLFHTRRPPPTGHEPRARILLFVTKGSQPVIACGAFPPPGQCQCVALGLSVYSQCCVRMCSAMVGVPRRPLLPRLPTAASQRPGG